MNDLQRRFHDMIITFIVDDDEISEQKIDASVDELHSMPTFRQLTHKELNEIRSVIKSEFSIKLDKGVLIEEQGHEKWFLAKKASLEMKYWERYRKYLLRDKGFSTKVVNTMDDVLDTLTDLLGDPSRNLSYKRRGLIIGDVQSGKTANYLGLICKGADSGYKVNVLMTGTIEKLRRQTQQRIDEGFVGADSDAMMKMREDGQLIGVGKYDPSIRPMVLTSTTDDFKAQNAKNLNFDLRAINGPVIFVVKKNVAILKRLNKWLKTFNQNGVNQIEQSILVIDDEADNASVNTNSDDKNPTAINGQIREMLKMFSKSSYVGFTATPFANIFIDPESYTDMVAEDLFPKDYIYSLNAPSNYIGARNIFTDSGAEGYMLEKIEDNLIVPRNIESIIPLKHKSNIQVRDIPDDMRSAVNTFVLANTIEDIRGMYNNHRSMLINVSRFTLVQEQVADVVNNYLKNIQNACRLYAKLPVEKAMKDEYIASLAKTFENIYCNVGIEWVTIQETLYQACASIMVATINQRSGKNLNYEDYKDGLRLIAVGGMSLSRGLTLEGLVISYFYRNSRMYDTLMQMGRWFGYRKGYADLCRIWMSEESIEWYRHISIATDELRDEIKRYEDTGLTPLEFGLRVRSDITSLIVTARNKMRSTESMECAISLSGICIETPEIYSDELKNTRNLDAIKSFIQSVDKEGYELERIKKKYGYRNIPAILILDFLETLDISPKNEHFNVSAIKRFIREYRGSELKKWDIAFATGTSAEEIDLGYGIKYNYPMRTYSIENKGRILKMSGSKRRIGSISDGKFGLDEDVIKKVEHSKHQAQQKDYFIDVDRNPLLTIYVVGLKECIKYENEDEKQNIKLLYKEKPVIGLGIGFPTLTDKETKYAKFVLNKIAIQQIFDYDIDMDQEDDED